MDFFAVVLFLFLYYIRPHDWIPALAELKPITLTMGCAVLGTLIRPRGFTLGKLAETPVQRAMWLYLVWILWAAPDFSSAFDNLKSAFIFFAATSLALSTPERLERYVRAWMWALIALATIAVLSLVGIDPTGAQDRTLAMKGRLCINTSMHNNPNALGHSVVVAVALIYFGLLWRSGVGRRVQGLLAIAVIATCVYFTESKGAYLVGFLTLVLSQLLGQSRVAQITLLSLAATFGVVAVTQLPRMETLNRNEPGIQGRLIAWDMARTSMKNHPTGVGVNNFHAEFKFNNEWVTKATHSSYVQVGAELGYGGLFLYAALFGCGFRTLVTARTRNDREERVRRMLFVLLFGTFASNFMKDMAFTSEFFVLMAAISAFHQLMREATTELNEVAAEAAEAAVPDPMLVGLPQPQLALAGIGGVAMASLPLVNPFRGDGTVGARQEPVEEESQRWPKIGIAWHKLGVSDALIGGLLYWFILAFWDHALKG